jgi:hypothetical protein
MPYYQDWYEKNRASVLARHARDKKAKRDWIVEYKSTRGCAKCPESDPRCLDFHHRDPSQKEFSMGNAVTLGVGWERLKAEAAKCEILCANCHRKI